ncbi:hypothetical protein J27TS7_23000 [Paenibacillus dendritiformis]|uniref:DUF5316 family protein n=1 Tax=Paenibacillus dendritiformis TaxID=130049 RepID=UPI001B2248DE|nr:DUF5316 family protein [Paenibacillus dendritiformis]GIO72786.1 hypothetical protein J27TS7_23000 [Paenibacillus dendritiformis]
MKYFGLACIISLVITGLAYTKGGWELAAEANAWPGGILLILAAILSGVLISGDRSRANFHSSSREEVRARTRWSGIAFVCSIPFLVVTVVYFITK